MFSWHFFFIIMFEMCELLVEKVLSSCLAPLSVGDALRRFFEAVASGVLLKSTILHKFIM